MAKLCQVIALANGRKTSTEKALTEIHRKTEKDVLLIGHERHYQPKHEDGEKQPSESKLVQVKVVEALKDAKTILTNLWEIVGVQDVGNTIAKADVVLEDGTVLATSVPVKHLLFLEKQLDNITKLISSLTILDPAQDWTYDSNKDSWVSKPITTLRTKKTTVPLVLSPATDKFPAQVKDITEDVVVGTWQQVNYSGGIPAKVKKDALERLTQVKDAVKSARELANQQDVEDVDVNSKILDFIFDPINK